MKLQAPKLTLNRETLLRLEDPKLRDVAAGAATKPCPTILGCTGYTRCF